MRNRYGRELAQEYMDEVNDKTICKNCGGWPVEWHNPDHIHEGKNRIGNMVSNGIRVESIQEELDKCIPLCRSCHMKEDGRLDKLHEAGRVYRENIAASREPRYCLDCSRES